MGTAAAGPAPDCPSARDAMLNYQFAEAFRLHMVAYTLQETSGNPDLLMRAARDLQMTENWRAQAGSWERLGNELGVRLDSDRRMHVQMYQYPEGRAFFGQFYVISDKEWEGIKVHCPDNCSLQCTTRQKQAYAYEWGAEAAAAAANYGDAARLYRRAGWAWEKAEHYGRTREDDSSVTIQTKRYRRAAKCYAQAAINASRTSRPSTRRMIASRPWCPACLRDKTREDVCDHTSELPSFTEAEDLPQTDVARLRRCWMRIARIERELLPFSTPEAAAVLPSQPPFDEGQQQLSLIQGLLASQGARKEARHIYRQRQQYGLDHYRETRDWRYHPLRVGWLLSRNGSSVGRLLAFLTVLYLVALPLAWLAYWAVSGPPAPPGQPLAPLPVEAVVFSLSNVVNLSNGHFAVTSWAATLLQAMQGLSAYFALVYVLYVAQRSYSV